MKRKIGLTLLFFICILNLYAEDEYYVENNPKDYLGVYLPTEYINSLNETKSHSISINLNKSNKYCDVLFVLDHIVYSNLKWHDQYAIKANDFKHYRFKQSGEDKYIYDTNGVSYKRISHETKDYYKVVDCYVLGTIFQNMEERDKIELKEDKVIINGKEYEPVLDEMFFQKGNNLILYQRSEKLFLALIIESGCYTFYKMKKESGEMLTNTKEIMYRINGQSY